MNVHQMAVVIIFCWACIYLFVHFFFRREAKRLERKIKETAGFCQPYLPIFVSENLIRDRNKVMVVGEDLGIIAATILMAGIIIATLILGGLIFAIFAILGYALFVFMAGLIPFLDIDGAFAYWYSRKIIKEPLEKLQDEDVSVMRWMLSILKSRQYRYKVLPLIVFCITLGGFILLKLLGVG